MAIGAFPYDQCFPNKTLSPISKASLSNHLLNPENQTKITASHQKYTKINSSSANFTKWSNTLKQFVGKLPANCWSVFDHGD